MDNLDLEIANYSDTDIEYFFQLDEIPNYGKDTIEQRAYETRTQLLNGGKFDSTEKRKLIEFIELAKTQMLKKTAHVRTKPLLQATTLDLQDTIAAPSRQHEIVKHPPANYYYSDPSRFYAGDLNPLNTRIVTQSLAIDSKFRDNYDATTSTDFMVNLPTRLTKIASMELSSVEFPVNFYGISASYGNNFFQVVINVAPLDPIDPDVVYSQVFTVPDGNYSNDEFIDVLNTTMGSNLPDPLNPYSCIQFSHDSITGKVTVTALTTILSTIQYFALNFDTDWSGNCAKTYYLTSRIGWNMGFTKPRYSEEVVYQSEALINPAPIKYVYLAIDDYNKNVNNGFISAFSSYLLNPDIMARITVNQAYFGLIVDTNRNLVTASREYFGPVDINRLHIRVLDDHGRILNMNHTDFSFCLTMKQIYNL
jgi:hypothetical protein